MTEELVLVTGASGFIANHVIQQLQQEGYRVRGTIRSLMNEESVSALKQICPDAKHPLELLEADLLQPESWKAAVKDCSYVIHPASPVPSDQPKNEDIIIQPAVEGTLNVLKACKEAGSVKRVIITSSSGAAGEAVAGVTQKKCYNESDWSDPSKPHMSAYKKSKVLAEKAAWDYMKEIQEEGSMLELVVLLPVLSLGPLLSGSTRSSSNIPAMLLTKAMPMLPNICIPIVDVHDVAAAHLKALKCPEAANNRHLIYSSSMWFSEIAQVINDEFKPQGYNIPTRVAPYFMMWIMSKFDTAVKFLLPNMGMCCEFDNTRMKSVLGIEPRPVKGSILDACYSLIESGNVKKTNGYKGPKYSTDQ